MSNSSGVFGLVDRLPRSARNFLKSLPGAVAVRDRLYMTPKGDSPPSGSLRPIVYLPTWLEWDVMKQRPQYLLEAMAAAGHDVWFVDPRSRETRAPSPGVTIVRSLQPVPARGVILYTHFAPNASLRERFEESVIVYDILDDLAIYEPDEEDLAPGLRVRRHHDDLVSSADVVFVSNRELLRRHSAERGDILVIENGVDLDVFSPAEPRRPTPDDRRVAGYHGAISLWFDFELMEKVVASRPDVTFVLVGPVDDRVARQVAAMTRSHANVEVVAEVPVAEVVDHVREFDAGLIPFTVDDVTRGVTPLKMYEYMAMEVPCVSTAIPAAVEHPDVFAASDPGQFVQLLDEALSMDPGRKRELRRLAEDASWSRRIEPLLERLDSLGSRVVEST